MKLDPGTVFSDGLRTMGGDAVAKPCCDAMDWSVTARMSVCDTDVLSSLVL